MNVTVARHYLPVNLRMVMYYIFFMQPGFEQLQLQYKMERKVYYEII